MPALTRFIDSFKKNAESRELRGHRDKVFSVGWSCDGKRVAAASLDTTARIWQYDRSSSRDCIELKGHGGGIDQLAWDPHHPEILCTASNDKSLRLWDIRTPRVATTIIPTLGEVINLTWSHDGKTIATGNKQDLVSFLDPRGGSGDGKKNSFVWHTIQNETETNELAWNYQMNLFFMTTGLGTIDMVSYPPSQPPKSYTVEAHTANCYCIDMDPKGRYFATGGADALVALWDMDLMACVKTVGRVESPVRAIAFSYDGEVIATGSEDRFIDVTHVESGEQICSISTNGPINSLAWHPSKHLLAYAADEVDRYGRPEGGIHIYGISSRP